MTLTETKQKTAADMLKSAYGQPSGERPEMPAELASAFNLMAHPLAGVAAMSAIGFGFASHAMGIWAGALEGAAAASQRLAPKVLDGLAPALQPDPASTVPLVLARLAVVTSLADARDAAKQPARSGTETLAKPAPTVPVVVEMPAPVTSAEQAAEVLAPVAKVEAPDVAAFDVPADARTDKRSAAKVKPTAAKAKIAAKAKPAVAVPSKTSPTARPAAIERPAMPDDLKAISGIGPKLEQVLNGLGIWTYGQIAGWSQAEIAWVDDRLGFSGRIGRDDWIGQAAALRSGKAGA